MLASNSNMIQSMGFFNNLNQIFEPYLNIRFEKQISPSEAAITISTAGVISNENTFTGSFSNQDYIPNEEVTIINKTFSNHSVELQNVGKDLSSIKELTDEFMKGKSKTVVTLSTPLELYKSEGNWKNASFHTKDLLNTFIIYVNQIIEESFDYGQNL